MKLTPKQQAALAQVIRDKTVVQGTQRASFAALHTHGLVRGFPGIRGSKEIRSVWEVTRKGMCVYNRGTGEIPADTELGLWGITDGQRVRAYSYGWDEFPTVFWDGALLATGSPLTRDVKFKFDPETGKCVNPRGMYPPSIAVPDPEEMAEFFRQKELQDRWRRAREGIALVMHDPHDNGDEPIWDLPIEALEQILKIIEDNKPKDTDATA